MSKTYDYITARINTLLTAVELSRETKKNDATNWDWSEAKRIEDKAWAEYLVLKDVQDFMLANGEV